MKRKLLPTISVVIPVYNEEKNLMRLIISLRRQTYPRERIEYIVIDDGSTDNGPKLAKDFGARVIIVETHDIELNKGIGMHVARGECVYWLDADMQLCSDDFWQKLVYPVIKEKNIIGSFSKEFALDGCRSETISSLLRFISYHPLQQDPLYAFFSPSIDRTIVQKRKGYFLCEFIPGKIPAVGRILYRRKELLGTDVGKNKSFIDLESVEIVARAGYQQFAYVPEAKIRHYHAEKLLMLIKKRLRNLERDYLPNLEHKYFLWFDPKSKKDILKVIFWVVYANLFIPELIRGLYKTLVYKDIAFMWHPVVALTTTDAIVYGFLSKEKGRKYALSLFKNLFLFKSF